MKALLVFQFHWSLVGFTAGTATLLGPVRWITTHGREQGWSEGTEATIVRLVIGLYVIASGVLAWWLSRGVLRSRLRHVRLGIPALALAATAASLWLWLSPELLAGSEPAGSDVGSSFTFGPYATEERMHRLRDEGYTAVVSLLHPLVAPFETKLIADGKAAAERVGLEYVHLPMLPWVSDNRDALAGIEELARNGTGRYYVHCYLGKDRVRLARRVVAEIDSTMVRADPTHAMKRRLRQGILWERGEVVRVAEGVFLTPFPTDDEFMSYILPTAHGRVVSLLDPDNPADLPWIEKERELLEAHGIPFVLRPLPSAEADPRQAESIAREVAGLPRPVVVHAFLAPGSGRSPAAASFLRAFPAEAPPPGLQEPESRKVEGPRRTDPREGILVGFLRRAVPDRGTAILCGPVLLVFAVGAAGLAGWLRTAREVRAPYTRKIFHFLIFTAAGILHLLGGLPAVALFGAIVSLVVLYAVVRGDGFPFYEAMARPTDSPRRTLFILVPLLTTALGGLAANLFFGTLAYVGYLVAGWGDAIAEPVGTAWGRHRYRVPSLGGVSATRSLEGSMAVLTVGGAAAFAGLYAGGVPAPAALSVALACGLAAALVEAVSNHGLDNLTVQLAASGMAYLLLV